jgi:hypothetical protein
MSIACVVRRAGQRTPRNQYRASAAPQIFGANSNGIHRAWRSFQAVN